MYEAHQACTTSTRASKTITTNNGYSFLTIVYHLGVYIMVITFRWPRPHDSIWSEEVALSLFGANTIVDGKTGRITEAQLDSLGDLLITIDIKEDDDASFG
jgi:hypothetical protein